MDSVLEKLTLSLLIKGGYQGIDTKAEEAIYLLSIN